MKNILDNSLVTLYSHAKKIVKDRGRNILKAGLGERPSFPRVDSFRSTEELQKALEEIQAWVDNPLNTVKGRRKAPEYRPQPERKARTQKPTIEATEKHSEESKLLAKRKKHAEAQKRYRERLKALSKNEKRLMTSAKTLGYRVRPSEAKQFQEYIEKRFALMVDKKKYAIDQFVQDYEELRKSGYSPEQINEDLEQYQKDLAELENRSNNFKCGLSDEDVQAFIDSKKDPKVVWGYDWEDEEEGY